MEEKVRVRKGKRAREGGRDPTGRHTTLVVRY